MEEGEPVRILIGLENGYVHQAVDCAYSAGYVRLEENLPDDLDLAITRVQGLSISPPTGLTGNRDGVQPESGHFIPLGQREPVAPRLTGFFASHTSSQGETAIA
jgi:hypothetical protein